MTEQQALQIASSAMITAAKLAAPIVLTSMAVGLVISIFQSITQIQEQTLTFVPKVLAVGLVLMIGGHWMLGQFIGLTHELFDQIPQLLSGG